MPSSERRKRQLNRNFVVNPEVSPTPEEERSSPDSGSLPELIVEPAPNLHDDPPEYYEGLERRMQQYYRKLFLGAHGNDDDNRFDFEVNRSMASTPKLDIDTRKDFKAMETRGNVSWHGETSQATSTLAFEATTRAHGSDDDIRSDFEVNRSMASTSKLDIDTRKDKAKGDSIRETQAMTSINSDDDYDESGTCETYNKTSHISIDDSTTFSNTGAHSESYKTDVDSNVNDHNEDNTNQPQATDEDRLQLQLNDDSRRLTVDEIEEIHEPRPDRPQMARSGSPVLTPSFIQFGRAAAARVFEKNSVVRHSGQSSKVSLASGAHGSDDDISSDFEVNRMMASTSKLDIDTRKDKAKDSEDSSQDCHKVSITIAQIHEPRPERPQMARSGSPVLTPGFTQFRRAAAARVFGKNSVGRHSGQSSKVSLASGAHGSDDDISSDFEVNRSMASTSKLDIDTRKDKAKDSEDSSQDCHKVSITIAQIHEPRPERPHKARSGSPVLTPGFTQFGRAAAARVFGKNSVGRHSGQSSKVSLASGAHGSDDDISSDFEVNRSMASTSKLDIDTRKDKAKDSEDSSQDCHKVSITIAQIHEPRPERPQKARSGSPVLTPGFTQFGRAAAARVFEKNSVGRHSGQSSKVSLASGKNTKTFSPQKSDSDMDRLPTASELIKASLDVYQTVENREEIDKSHAEIMREAIETRGNVSWHGKTSQATPTLAFEAPTSAKELQDTCIEHDNMNPQI